MPHRLALLTLLSALAALGACQKTLTPTPYVMLGEPGRAIYAEVPDALRTPEIPVIYVTDRAVDEATARGPRYGFERDRSLAFGVATVSVGNDADWPTLVADSTQRRRSREYPVRLERVEPLGKFGDLLTLIESHEGRMTPRSDAMDMLRAQGERFDALLDTWLARSPRKEVIVFVHGFNNQLEHAVLRTAEAWHLSGRAGVPIVYSWPAGSGGLKGYAYDRESGEFTIVHLKLLLYMLARHPQVEKVHLVAHSRGTDVATTTLRELHNEIRGVTRTSLVSSLIAEPMSDPPETYEVLKLETLVLAAPDMDVDVFIQRFFAENLLRGARRVAVYASGRDEALGMADWLFRSRRRLGNLRMSDLHPEGRKLLASTDALELIECQVSGTSSHAYLAEHPAALSDLILLLRDGAEPGSPGRPLARPDAAVWQLTDAYLRPAGSEAYTGWPN